MPIDPLSRVWKHARGGIRTNFVAISSCQWLAQGLYSRLPLFIGWFRNRYSWKPLQTFRSLSKLAWKFSTMTCPTLAYDKGNFVVSSAEEPWPAARLLDRAHLYHTLRHAGWSSIRKRNIWAVSKCIRNGFDCQRKNRTMLCPDTRRSSCFDGFGND
jgi:hypothetical protein